MENINKLFKNAVLDMSKEELLTYVNKKMMKWELVTSLLSIDENRKAEILDEEMNKAMAEIFGKLSVLGAKLENYKKEEEKTEHLQKLEGRILLNILTMRLALNSHDKKLLQETNVMFHELNIEYRSDGGDIDFYHQGYLTGIE